MERVNGRNVPFDSDGHGLREQMGGQYTCLVQQAVGLSHSHPQFGHCPVGERPFVAFPCVNRRSFLVRRCDLYDQRQENVARPVQQTSRRAHQLLAPCLYNACLSFNVAAASLMPVLGAIFNTDVSKHFYCNKIVDYRFFTHHGLFVCANLRGGFVIVINGTVFG